MRVLPDTSVWIGYLRRRPRRRSGELDELLQNGELMICGPVIAELFAGASPSQRNGIWRGIARLPWADVDHNGWRMAGEISASLHAKGKALPLTDIVIATACITADALLWTNDSDFERIRSVAPRLKLYQPAG